MKLTIILFAAFQEETGQEEIALDLPSPATVATLRKAFTTAYPALEHRIAHSLFAVNQAYVGEAQPLSPEDEIACIPPVSGG